MKKLMFAAAAMAAGIAVADVQSANIVGYARTSEACQGYYDRGAMFNTIGIEEDGVDIQSIIPVPSATAATELEDMNCFINEINDSGAPISEFVYAIEGSETVPGGKAGWYVLDYETSTYTRANKKFIRGEGFTFQSPYFEDESGEEAGSGMQVSGEVNLTAKTLKQDCQGYYLRANYRAVDLDIQKIIPCGSETADTELEDMNCFINEINDSGAPISEFVYAIEGSETVPGGKAGWYVLDYATSTYTYADKKFKPGEGFIFQSPYFEDESGEEAPSCVVFQE